MKTRISKSLRIAALLTLLASVPAVITCDHPSAESLFLMDAMAMDAQTQCQIRPGAGAQTIRPFGTLDLLITNQYWMFPRFRNMMLPLNSVTGEGPTSPEAETHYLSVQQAKVFVDWGTDLAPRNAAEGALYQKYFVDGVTSFVTAGVAPQTEGAVAVQVIPPELGNHFEGKLRTFSVTSAYPAVWVTAHVSVYGQTQDRNVVRSNEMAFPIRLCYGCLVAPICPTTVSALPCNIGQDESIDAASCFFLANNPDDCTPKCWPGQQ